MTIGVVAVGGCRGLLTDGARAEVEVSILEEAGGSGGSIFEGIKSDSIGRTSGFIKPLEKVSAITFM